MHGKGKDMIILKSIIKENYNMRIEYTENKRRLCIPQRNNGMI